MGRSATGKEESETFTVKYWFEPAQGFEVFRWFLGNRKLLCTVGFKRFYGKRPHLFLRSGSRDPHGKVTIISVSNCLIVVEFLWYIHNLQIWPWVGDPCSTQCEAYAYVKMQTTSMSIIKHIQLILLRDINGIDCEHHTKDANTHCG